MLEPIAGQDNDDHVNGVIHLNDGAAAVGAN
jgi:hypothetical protein